MTNIWNDIYVTVINLSKDTERREFMEQQLRAIHAPYTILPAVDGRHYDFSYVYDEEKAKKEHGASLTAPEKGCALSHLHALEAFLHSGKTYGLIMEDDVTLPDEFPSALTYTLGRADTWSYVQFNYGPVGFQGVRLWWFLFTKKKDKKSLDYILGIPKGLIANVLSLLWGVRDWTYRIFGGHGLASLVRDQYLAGCYVLTRDAAEAIINLNTPLTFTADRVQNIARRRDLIKEKIFIPRIVRQKRESFTSSINNDHYGEAIIAA